MGNSNTHAGEFPNASINTQRLSIDYAKKIQEHVIPMFRPAASWFLTWNPNDVQKENCVPGQWILDQNHIAVIQNLQMEYSKLSKMTIENLSKDDQIYQTLKHSTAEKMRQFLIKTELQGSDFSSDPDDDILHYSIEHDADFKGMTEPTPRLLLGTRPSRIKQSLTGMERFQMYIFRESYRNELRKLYNNLTPFNQKEADSILNFQENSDDENQDDELFNRKFAGASASAASMRSASSDVSASGSGNQQRSTTGIKRKAQDYIVIEDD